ncbi:MAG: beta-ketoacyl-ACP synthase II [Herpetosiphon sp.]
MEPKRVVVTGMGLLTPIGHGPAAFWAAIKAGQTGIHTITRFDPTPFRTHMAAQIDDFDPRDFLDAKQARRLDRYAQFSLVAARMAVADARLDLTREDPTRIGVYVGSALGGIAFGEEQHETFVTSGVRAINPALALAIFVGASPSNIAMDLGINGPNVGNSSSCAAGPVAMGEAFRLIKMDQVDMMLAGGVEVPLAPLTFGSFAVIKAMSTRNDDPEHASRPFDVDRDGFVMGEAAAIFVLEEREHALRRDAHIYGEILGYGTTNDAYHMTAPRPDGREAARAINLALSEARLAPTDIGYINAHASSTALNDATETRAIRLALGSAADHIPISGTKGYHGHSFGASGSIEAAVCMLALGEDLLPYTLNLEQPSPECDLPIIQHRHLRTHVDYMLSNSFGFGGINTTLAFGRAT